MSTPKDGKRWLIWSIKHNAWWRFGEAGYHGNRQMAGRYSFDEACGIVKRSNQHGGDMPSSAMVEDTDSNRVSVRSKDGRSMMPSEVAPR